MAPRKNPASAARKAINKSPTSLAELPRSAFTTALDKTINRNLQSRFMTKRSGTGPSRRGSHRLSATDGCPTQFKYRIALGAQPRESNYYLEYGTLMHTAQAYYYVPRMERKPQWYLDFPDMEAALLEDSLGHDDRLRKVKETMLAYDRWESGQQWFPLYNEEEFEATVGKVDPEGQDESPFVVTYTDRQGNTVVKVFPSLNDEIVTCRPDLIIPKNGGNYIVDHKTGGADRKGTGRLPIIDPRFPDYSYGWQAMFNLCVVRAAGLQVEGFIFNRIKRDPPFDFARDLYDCSEQMYSTIPGSIRAAVIAERDSWRRMSTPGSIFTKPWECSGCSYKQLCYADSKEQRDFILETCYDFVEVKDVDVK